MAIVRPFKAYRPAKGLEQSVAALPYDVYSRKEAKEYVLAHPKSFLAIDRPETQFDDDCDMYDSKVYEKAGEMLKNSFDQGIFVQDEKPYYYLYKQTWKGRSQTGIVGCCAIDDYLHGVIKKHENTVEAKEQDRIHHVDSCNAQTGPIFLTYRRNSYLAELTQRICKEEPDCAFTSDGDVGNTVWTIRKDEDIAAIQEEFAHIDRIYIADGHHRAASAVKVGLNRREEHKNYDGTEEFNYFLSALFPDDELDILSYNRLVKDRGTKGRAEILSEIRPNFNIVPCHAKTANPQAKGEIGMYLDHSWYLLTAKNHIKSADAVKSLDVSLLQDRILSPIFGIDNPRTDSRIEFIGGIRGSQELMQKADAFDGVAFSMYPTSIQELFAVADAGRLMPPKSTWFEPKLLSGLFIHSLT